MSNPVQIQCAGIRNVTVANFDVPNLDKSHELGKSLRCHRIRSGYRQFIIHDNFCRGIILLDKLIQSLMGDLEFERSENIVKFKN